MTELERKALLGDQEAQRECTEKGIVLPCSRCCKQGNPKENLWRFRKMNEFFCAVKSNDGSY